jgi:hypothetical protein
MRIETNHPLVLRRLESGLDSLSGIPETPVAHWKIVVEDEINLPPVNSPFQGLTHDGLAFVRIELEELRSPGAFLAADRQAGRGVSFVATEFVEQEQLFVQYYLPALLLMLHETADKE